MSVSSDAFIKKVPSFYWRDRTEFGGGQTRDGRLATLMAVGRASNDACRQHPMLSKIPRNAIVHSSHGRQVASSCPSFRDTKAESESWPSVTPWDRAVVVVPAANMDDIVGSSAI